MLEKTAAFESRLAVRLGNVHPVTKAYADTRNDLRVAALGYDPNVKALAYAKRDQASFLAQAAMIVGPKVTD